MNHLYHIQEPSNQVLYDLKWYQKYDRLKLKSLNESWTFNFDLSYLWYPLMYRVIQYLIEKLLDMVKIFQVRLVVAALLASVRASWKVTIYYINGALLKLIHYTLYVTEKCSIFTSPQWLSIFSQYNRITIVYQDIGKIRIQKYIKKKEKNRNVYWGLGFFQGQHCKKNW